MSSETEGPRVSDKPFVSRAVASLSQALNIGAVIALVLMMLLSVADIFLRNSIKYAIPDSQELVQYLMICVGFWAMAWRAVKNGHVAVDLLVNRFSPRTQAVFDCITYFLGLGVCALISWRSFLEVPIVFRLNQSSIYLHVPVYPFYFILALGIAVLCLVMLTQLIQSIRKAVKK